MQKAQDCIEFRHTKYLLPEMISWINNLTLGSVYWERCRNPKMNILRKISKVLTGKNFPKFQQT